jgi:hypothetical protein
MVKLPKVRAILIFLEEGRPDKKLTNSEEAHFEPPTDL